MMPKRQPPPGCEPGEVHVARGSIYGTRLTVTPEEMHTVQKTNNLCIPHERLGQLSA